MAKTNKTQKRKANSSKKNADAEATKMTPLTFQEIAFINRTEPPPKEAQSEHNPITDKLLHQLLEMLIKQFEQFVETYGGYYTRAALMDMLGITSKNTFNIWMKEKGLPYYQVDTRVLIKKTDLEDFLKSYRKIMPVIVLYFSGLSDVMGAWLLAA